MAYFIAYGFINAIQTLDKKWIIVMIQWELNPCHAQPEKTMNSK